MIYKKDERINGEYDPPYVFNENPTEEQRRIAKELIEKYEKLAEEKTKIENN